MTDMIQDVPLDVETPAQVGPSVAEVDFSPRASRPTTPIDLPLPGTDAFTRVRGRAGDLIVLQLKSGDAGETEQRKAALQTLNLRGIGSASLRFSTDASTWGNVQVVRDIVAVIEFPTIQYGVAGKRGRHDPSSTYETLPYGTGTKPAQIWRTLNDGRYYAYESDRTQVVTFWSSDCDLPAFLNALEHGGFVIDEASPETYLYADDRGHEGQWNDLRQTVEVDRIVSIVLPLGEGAEATWRAPHQRFHDMDSMHACVGLNSAPPDIHAVRRLFQVTADPTLQTDVPCSVRIRTNGKVKDIQL